MMCCPNAIGLFEIRALDPLTRLFFFLLFICYNMLTCVSWFSWQALIALTSKTWVRAPGLRYSSYYFSTGIHVRFQRQGIAYTSIIKPATRPGKSNQRYGSQEYVTLQSTHQHARKKSKKAILNGPEFHKLNLHIGTETPLVCNFSYSSYILFFIIVLFSLFV